MSRRLRRALGAAAVLAAAVLWAAPAGLMVLGSLTPDDAVLARLSGNLAAGGLTVTNYVDVARRTDIGANLLTSLVVNGLIVVLGLAVNSAAGYALARLEWRGRRVALATVTAIMVVPFEAIAVPLFAGASAIGWRDGWLVQALPFVAQPLAVVLFWAYFRTLPREIEEAAWVEGAGIARTFVSVVAPASRPAFAAVGTVTLLLQWGMYLWPLLMTVHEDVRPLPLGIATLYGLPPLAWGDVLAYGGVMVAPVLVLFVIFQGAFLRGVASTGLGR